MILAASACAALDIDQLVPSINDPAPLWSVALDGLDNSTLAHEVWQAVQRVIESRLDLRQSFDDFAAVEAEASAYATLVGLDGPAISETGREAHPPSKALVKRREAVSNHS